MKNTIGQLESFHDCAERLEKDMEKPKYLYCRFCDQIVHAFPYRKEDVVGGKELLCIHEGIRWTCPDCLQEIQ